MQYYSLLGEEALTNLQNLASVRLMTSEEAGKRLIMQSTPEEVLMKRRRFLERCGLSFSEVISGKHTHNLVHNVSPLLINGDTKIIKKMRELEVGTGLTRQSIIEALAEEATMADFIGRSKGNRSGWQKKLEKLLWWFVDISLKTLFNDLIGLVSKFFRNKLKLEAELQRPRARCLTACKLAH